MGYEETLGKLMASQVYICQTILNVQFFYIVLLKRKITNKVYCIDLIVESIVLIEI